MNSRRAISYRIADGTRGFYREDDDSLSPSDPKPSVYSVKRLQPLQMSRGEPDETHKSYGHEKESEDSSDLQESTSHSSIGLIVKWAGFFISLILAYTYYLSNNNYVLSESHNIRSEIEIKESSSISLEPHTFGNTSSILIDQNEYDTIKSEQRVIIAYS